MRWRLSLSYREALKGTDTLFVDVLIKPIPQRRRADPELQTRMDAILDRAFLRHEAYRAEARSLDDKAARARSASWRSRWRREAAAIRAAGARTERRAAKYVRELEREHDARYGGIQKPSREDIRQAYIYALREGKQPPGYSVQVVTWWHVRRGQYKEASYREGTVADLPSMFGPLSDRKAKLVIGEENENE